MENVLKYFEFSDFFQDNSEAFSNNLIAYSELNAQHFLIFENDNNSFNLYITRFQSKSEIGKQKPEILELVVKNYDKSKPEHRIAIRRYFE